MLSFRRFILLILPCLLLAILLGAPVVAGESATFLKKLEAVNSEDLTLEEAKNFIDELDELKALAKAESSFAESLYESPISSKEEREYSELERRIAQEVIATGQMLGGDPRFEDVVSILSQRG